MSREVLRRVREILREERHNELGTPEGRRDTGKFALKSAACITPFVVFVAEQTGVDIKTLGLAAVGTAIGTVALVGGGVYAEARRDVRRQRGENN